VVLSEAHLYEAAVAVADLSLAHLYGVRLNRNLETLYLLVKSALKFLLTC